LIIYDTRCTTRNSKLLIGIHCHQETMLTTLRWVTNNFEEPAETIRACWNISVSRDEAFKLLYDVLIEVHPCQLLLYYPSLKVGHVIYSVVCDSR